MDILGWLIYEFLLGLNLLSTTILNSQIVWITLPIYISWIVTAYFQEKREVQYEEVATNSTIMMYTSLNWIGYLINEFKEFNLDFLSKIIVSILFFAISLFTLINAIKRRKVSLYLGNITTISYFQIVYTPIIYNLFELNLDVIIAILLYWPVFFFIIHKLIIQKLLPDIFGKEEYSEESTYKEIEYSQDYYQSFESRYYTTQNQYQQYSYQNPNYYYWYYYRRY